MVTLGGAEAETLGGKTKQLIQIFERIQIMILLRTNSEGRREHLSEEATQKIH